MQEDGTTYASRSTILGLRLTNCGMSQVLVQGHLNCPQMAVEYSDGAARHRNLGVRCQIWYQTTARGAIVDMFPQ